MYFGNDGRKHRRESRDVIKQPNELILSPLKKLIVADWDDENGLQKNNKLYAKLGVYFKLSFLEKQLTLTKIFL